MDAHLTYFYMSVRPSSPVNTSLRQGAELLHIEVHAPAGAEYADVLTPEALEFVAGLVREFGSERKALLRLRERRQRELDSGLLPDFLPETTPIREAEWRVARPPADLMERTVEITGPSGDPKMMINALNSGANVYMADFEDSQSPTWDQTMKGQENVMAAVRRTLRYVNADGKGYALEEKTATLIVRPRGWHLVEGHVTLDGEPVPASLFDFGLFVFHNASELLRRGSGPYLYLPKLENHLEARLWNKVFDEAERALGIPSGSIRVTVLIENVLAAFEMDEILYELRGRAVGLNCGRWDYIFSYIKKLRNHPGFVLPDRAQVTMDRAFLAAYVDLLIKTCHRRGAYAIGGMSAYIPVKKDEAANELALQRVRADKEREARLGHDGTWVAHPGLVGVARGAFVAAMPGPNQLHVLRDDVRVSRDDLLQPAGGSVTMAGVRTNVAVGLRYLSAWLDGRGCVPIDGLMEDAATSEICRAQIWQWVRHGAHLDDGREVTPGLVLQAIAAEATCLSAVEGDEERVRAAQRIFTSLAVADDHAEFLTLPAYAELMMREEGP